MAIRYIATTWGQPWCKVPEDIVTALLNRTGLEVLGKKNLMHIVRLYGGPTPASDFVKLLQGFADSLIDRPLLSCYRAIPYPEHGGDQLGKNTLVMINISQKHGIPIWEPGIIYDDLGHSRTRRICGFAGPRSGNLNLVGHGTTMDACDPRLVRMDEFDELVAQAEGVYVPPGQLDFIEIWVVSSGLQFDHKAVLRSLGHKV